jgi:hypothetical protein
VNPVADPYSKTLRWTIISSRILVLPMVIELGILAWGGAMWVIEPRMFSGYGAILLALCLIAGFHGVIAAPCVLLGWRMARLRRLDLVPRTSAVWGALAGFLYFFAPAAFFLLGFNGEVLAFFAIVAFFTWPSLLFAILCVKLRAQAPARGEHEPLMNDAALDPDADYRKPIEDPA